MVRKLVQLKGFDVCQRPRLQEARGRVDFRSRARVDHDGLPAQDASPSVGEPNLDRLRADKPALAHDELGPARRISLSIDPVQVVDHLALRSRTPDISTFHGPVAMPNSALLRKYETTLAL